MSNHQTGPAQAHTHGPACGHTAIDHAGHADYLHDGKLEHVAGKKVEAHALDVNAANPAACTPAHACAGHDATHAHGAECGHEAVPHGDHKDYLVNGHLHHPCNKHCDDHGKVKTSSKASSQSIRPLHDRIVIECVKEAERSKGGIIIPDTAKEKPMEGHVIAVGNGKVLDDGTVRKVGVNVGDRVLFAKYGGTEVKVDGAERLVVREDDILAVLES